MFQVAQALAAGEDLDDLHVGQDLGLADWQVEGLAVSILHSRPRCMTSATVGVKSAVWMGLRSA